MNKRKDPNIYPPGLDSKKISRIIAYYDARQIADLREDPDHELLDEPTSWLEIPRELVPHVRRMIARHKKSA